MNKLEMAHDCAIALVNSGGEMQFDKFIRLCWNYADAMQAEADKREKEEAAQKHKEIREMLNAPNTFVEREGQHFDDVEWQPDWSQAPEWVTHFFCEQDEDDERKLNSFWCEEGYRIQCFDSGYRGYGRVISAPDFGYTGNWQDSLRKRPQ